MPNGVSYVQFIFHVHPHHIHIAKRYWDAHKFVNIMCVVIYIATTEILKSHIKDTETAGVKILFEFLPQTHVISS